MTPTFDEFQRHLKSAKKGSAGGMSGLTYDMMKCWPLQLLKAVHADLVELWDSDIIPTSWNCRWVQLIPKKDEPGLSDLRPLCLLEVMRKVWAKTFVSRINDHLHLQGGFGSQHCGKGRGTNSGFAETAAMIQTAKAYR